MSYFASQLPGAYDPPQVAWTSVYMMDTTGDYIEWDFTLTGDEAEQANTGYPLWSGRINCESNPPATGGQAQITVNGVPVGSIPFFSGLQWTRPLVQDNATWDTDIGGFRMFYDSQNIFQTGTNTLRVQLIPFRNPVEYDLTFPDDYSEGHAVPYGIEFIAAEFQPLDNFGAGRLIGNNSNYTGVDESYGVFPGFPDVLPRPPWLTTHTNPTYDHTQFDAMSFNVPVAFPEQSGSLPTFLFLATDGTTGHADLVDMTVTEVRKTSSSVPVMESPLTIEYDVTVSAGSGDIILLDSVAVTDTNGNHSLLDHVADRQSGPSATVTLSQDLHPPSPFPGIEEFGNAQGIYIIYGGDATTQQPVRGQLVNLVVSPFLVPEPTYNTRYNISWTATEPPDLDVLQSGPILLNVYWSNGEAFPDAYAYVSLFGQQIVSVVYEQVPATYSWESDGTTVSGTGVPVVFTHEYPHQHGRYPVTLTTTGHFSDAIGFQFYYFFGNFPQTNVTTNDAAIAWFSGWLHFTSPSLSDATFEPFTDQPLDQEGFANVEATDTTGYVEWSSVFPPDASDPEVPVVVGYPPSGGARVSTSYPDPNPDQEPLDPWCWAADQSHIWTVRFVEEDPFNTNICYGPIEGPYVVMMDTAADEFRSESGVQDLKVDMSTGLLYVLWKGPFDESFDEVPFIDQVDATGTVLQTYYPTDVDDPFFDTRSFAGMIAVSNGVLYFAGSKQVSAPAPIDRIWQIDTVTGLGVATHAFTTGTGQFITGLTGGGGGHGPSVPAIATSVKVTAIKQSAIAVDSASAVSS